MSKNGNVRGSLFRSVVVFFILLTMIIASVSAFGCKEADIPSGEDRQGGEVSTSEPSASGADLSFEAYGKIAECSTYAKGELLADTFYYKDAWFGEDPTTRNDALALMSMQLAAAAVTNAEDGAGASALRALGFERVGFVGFSTEDPDDCAYTWATKQLGGQTLVAIVFQSYALDSATKVKGWTQNFHVNDQSASGEHAAFKKAAEKALDGIISLGGDDAVYWLMGQSRAGAIANLTAAKLSNRLENGKDRIFAYTFEAPATVDGSIAAAQGAKYSFIHNYIASDDIVPLVPMWGMTLYGNRYEVKSEATELALSDELKKIGSSAADVEFGDNEEKIASLVSYLESRLSSGTASRADYSKLRRDVYTGENGDLVTIEYTYQEVMEHLIRAIFSGEFSEIDAEKLEKDLSIFSSSVYSLAASVKGEGTEDAVTVATYYYQAAQGIRKVVKGLIPKGEVSLTDLDFYALLRLAGPLMLDSDYEEEGDPKYDVSGYIYPTIDLAQSLGKLSYAHHFDTVIARLKTMAPQPAATSFALTVSQPKAGDPLSLLAEEFAEKVKGVGASWFTSSKVGWNCDGQTLQAGSVCYFDAKTEIVGHRVLEDFNITLNGMAPIDLSCEYVSGVCIVSLRWEIEIGTPEQVTLRFASGHGAAVPAAISVDKGKILKYAEKPIFVTSASDEGKTFLFDNWRSADGREWEEITADKDMTLSAHWIRVIDELEITFSAPSVGGEAELPSVPKDAPYFLSEYHVYDEDYSPIEDWDDVTKKAGEYNIALFFLAIEGESIFAEETIVYDEDYSERVYSGSVLLNGEAYDDYFYGADESPVLLFVSIDFTVE